MEVSYSVLEIIQCCLSRYKEKHFIKTPVTLPCNHHACFDCVNNKILNQTLKEIECFYPECNRKHKIEEELNDIKTNKDIDLIIRQNTKDLFDILKNSLKHAYENFDSKKSKEKKMMFKLIIYNIIIDIDFELGIDKDCEFIENDIDLRIESLKFQLDKLSELYHEKLKFFKETSKE
jgi:hypothetical protein